MSNHYYKKTGRIQKGNDYALLIAYPKYKTHTHGQVHCFTLSIVTVMINYFCVEHRQNEMINDMSAFLVSELMGRGYNLYAEEENSSREK